jgi:hypothetical protein
MAKNFPYFKFIVSEWMTGDIVFESLSVQGLFINICALYWQRDGILSVEDINKRYKNPSELNELVNRFLIIHEGLISIKFLDEQLIDANHVSKVNSENGKKSAEKRATVKRTLNESSTTVQRISTNKNKRKEEKEEKENIPEFLNFKIFAFEKKPNVCETDLKLKYDSWIANDWKNGNDKKIKNWKSTLLNTLPFIKDGLNSNINKPLKMVQ